MILTINRAYNIQYNNWATDKIPKCGHFSMVTFTAETTFIEDCGRVTAAKTLPTNNFVMLHSCN